MTSLTDTQRLFTAAIDATVDPPAFTRLLTPAAGPTSAERIAIYRNNTLGGRARALSNVHPVCAMILGERCFGSLARRYAAERPSTDADLNLHGADFSHWLAPLTQPGGKLEGLPYLPDLARLEWLWHAVYYAPDDSPFDVRGFAAAASQDPAGIRFALAASLRLLRSDYPIHGIWQAHRAGEAPGEFPLGDGDHLVIWRPESRGEVTAVDQPVFALLEAMVAGHTLTELEAQGHSVEVLPDLIARRWITHA